MEDVPQSWMVPPQWAQKSCEVDHMPKILLVDDSLEIIAAVGELLRAEQYEVQESTTAADCIQVLTWSDFDLLILDWQLPDKSGVEILSWYRKRGGTARVLMLTARAHSLDKETGLDSGADDYLTKPFDTRELLARIRALLRRSSSLSENILRAGNLQLHLSSLTVQRGDEEIELNKQECKLLELFMRNPNRVYTEDSIISRLWTDEEATSDAFRSALKRLRKKVDPDGNLIKNIRGVGYMFKIGGNTSTG